MKKSMRVILPGLVLGLLLVSQGPGLWAHEGHKGKYEKMDVGKKLEKLTKKFDLTKEQQDQVRKLLEDKKNKMLDIEKQEEEIQKSYKDQFRNLLTDAQKQKLDEDKSKSKGEKIENKEEEKEERKEEKK